MRTPTVAFLVLFLCLFSSQERRSKLRSVVEGVKGQIHEATRGHLGHQSSRSHSSRACRDAGCSTSKIDLDESNILKDQLRQLGEKDETAEKTLRTIDRGIRTLDDRINKLERECARQPHLQEAYERSLKLLLRQRLELASERTEVVDLVERIEGESIRLKAEIDIAKIRAERREVESFLNRNRTSPMEKLAEGY